VVVDVFIAGFPRLGQARGCRSLLGVVAAVPAVLVGVRRMMQ